MLKIFIYESEFYINKDGKKIGLPSEITKNDIESEIRNFLLNIENQNISGIKINKMYTYDEIELYNFCRGSLYDKLKSLLNKFALIENIIEFYDEEIEISTDDLVFKYLAEEVFYLKCEYKCINTMKKKKNSNNLKKIIRVIRGFSYLLKAKIKNKNNELFITQANSINSISINNKVIDYDSQFGNVLGNSRKCGSAFILQYLNNESLLDKSIKLGKDIFPFENFIFMKKFIYKLNMKENKINNNLRYLKDIDFSFHNKNLYEFINKFLLQDLEKMMNNYLYEIYAAEKFLKFIKAKKVIAIDEADRIRCFIYAANKLNIPSYAIQHGIITLGSSAYFIPSEDDIYISNKTFVWGKKFRDTLIENTKIYSDKNVEIVGQIRTDYLFNKLKYDSILNENSEVKILYATQSIKDLTYEATEMLFEGLENLKIKYALVIKLHPNDIYEDLYTDLIDKYNIKNVRITRSMDIYDAINWSDVVISVHSTVNLEAAILNKPSICILLNKYWDEGNFVRDNISLGVKNKDELTTILGSLDSYKLDNENVIKEYFYKIDGLVSERINNSINYIK